MSGATSMNISRYACHVFDVTRQDDLNVTLGFHARLELLVAIADKEIPKVIMEFVMEWSSK